MTPDAAPLRNWSGVTRAEARTANPLLAPSAALGANFRLDGTTNLTANYVVAYLVLPACPARDAYELALSMNGAQLAPVEGAASDSGVVAYAAPVNGITDVYVYLTTLLAAHRAIVGRPLVVPRPRHVGCIHRPRPRSRGARRALGG